MRYLLDTNVCVAYLRARVPAPLDARMRALLPGEAVVCSVVRAELMSGAHRSARPEQAIASVQTFLSSFQSLPFDDAAADAYSAIRHDLLSKRQVIGDADMMIAGITLTRGLVLVTHNVREFDRVPGLSFEDWEAA